MYLIISIVLATLLGCVLLMFGPLAGGIIAFGIIGGTLFRGLYLLQDFQKRFSKVIPAQDKTQEIYNNYLEEKKINNRKFRQ